MGRTLGGWGGVTVRKWLSSARLDV